MSVGDVHLFLDRSVYRHAFYASVTAALDLESLRSSVHVDVD